MKNFKNLIMLIILIFTGCNINNTNKIDYCELSNLIYLEYKKEITDLSVPILYKKIGKINIETIKFFLEENSIRFNDFDIENYFNTKSNGFSVIECNNVDSNFFNSGKKIDSTEQYWKDYESEFGKNNLIRFYEPVFNKDKSEFILLYEFYSYGIGSNYKLVLYKNLNDNVIVKEVLLIST